LFAHFANGVKLTLRYWPQGYSSVCTLGFRIRGWLLCVESGPLSLRTTGIWYSPTIPMHPETFDDFVATVSTSFGNRHDDVAKCLRIFRGQASINNIGE